MIETVKKGRKIFYTDGEILGDRVTKIIGNLDKPGLMYWTMNTAVAYIKEVIPKSGNITYNQVEIACDMSKKEPFKDKDKALDIGSAVHDTIDGHIKAKIAGSEFHVPVATSDELGKDIIHCFNNFLELEDSLNIEYIESERMLFYKMNDVELGDIGYGGTVDCIADVDGDRTILDWKTSKRIYEPSMPLQLGAYMLAYEQETGNVVEGGGIVGRIDKEKRKVEIKRYSADQLYEYGTAFLNLFKCIKRLESISK